MTDWFTNISVSSEPAVGVILVHLLLSWAAGCGVAYLARLHQKNVTDETLSVTLVLMCVLIAMATQIIGENVARAFSLVGALSIVRFRTAMQTTQDVAFVLFAVVIGMAIGAGQYWVATLGFIVIGAATHFQPSWSTFQTAEIMHPAGVMLLRMQIALGAENIWDEILSELCESYENTGAETIRKGSAFALEFHVILREHINADTVIMRLGRLEQIESVQIKRCRK
ncbi:hypothetical protein Pan241w_17850 [Gimesia alba]|uniref:Mg(2+) transport ATPase n=1 Tax=Gimesia alba TaxID=2527973 RepID=A0A517RCX0_9PLAN|nr:DUF4956 domain-containing protein [Gimesia alba]QDT41722.1 hypothetical protein Pan241w_17850 [Gimesia alba]